jgi:ubiquinone/menaquinone biosynthesis C-methylase UbiE
LAKPDIYDPTFVKNVFDRCSDQYIAFSYWCSFGFTERWRKQCVDLLDLGDAAGKRGYDLMAGTGESWPHLLRKFPDLASITGIDISTGMHRRAVDRLHRHRAHLINFIEDDVLASDLPDKRADFVIATFGLKTFSSEQHARFAALVARILKPGGSFAMIEASDPKGWILRPFYMFYLTRFLPLIERLFLKGAQDFAMIGEYSSRFGDASQFAGMLESEGLSVRFRKHFFGCATSVSGKKPIIPER